MKAPAYVLSLALAGALLALPRAPALAQAILNAGPVTAGHAPMYTNSGSGGQVVAQDSGSAGGGAAGLGLKELLIVKRGTGAAPYANQGTGPLATSNCMYDGPTTSAGGYHYLCFDPNAQGGGLIAYGAGGAASQLPLRVNINGSTFGFLPTCTTLGAFAVYSTGSSSWVCSTDPAPQVATLNGTLNIAPLANSLQQGISINQVGPSVDPAAGAVVFNVVRASYNAPILGDGSPGTPTCACWSLQQIAASVGSNYDTRTGGGAPTTGQAFGLAVGMVTNGANTSSSDLGGGASGMHTDYAWPNARGYGWTSSASVGASGALAFAIGHEFGVALENTVAANVPYRAGINIDNYGSHRAGTLDSAITVVGGTAGGEWGNFVSFIKPPGVTTKPLATTANVIYAVEPQTINSIIEGSNWTIAAFVYNTANAKLSGAGLQTLGSATAPGGLEFKGGALDSLPTNYTFNGTTKWQQLSTPTTWVLGPVGGGGTSINADFTTGLVSLPSGVAVTGTATATGAITAMSGTAIPVGGTAGSGFKFSSTANYGVFFGSGAPALSAAKGSLYLRSDGTTTNDRAYVNTDGSTTWTSITTGSWLFERDINPANENRPAFVHLAA